MELGKKGADRQKMHEEIRKESLKAWQIVQEGGKNPLEDYLKKNKNILSYMKEDEIEKALDASLYTGDAIKRTEMVLKRAQKALEE